MSEVVNMIKDQYARKLNQEDWMNFLSVAEYHIEVAAKLRKKDISYVSKNKKLLIRNSMKRLHLGIGVELALKAAYLKNGICINKLKRNSGDIENSPIHLLSEIDHAIINSKDTFTMEKFISKYSQVFRVDSNPNLLKGLLIAMTFRNKEGHTSYPKHVFDASSYNAIAFSITHLYKEIFEQDIELHIAMKSDEKGVFVKHI